MTKSNSSRNRTSSSRSQDESSNGPATAISAVDDVDMDEISESDDAGDKISESELMSDIIRDKPNERFGLDACIIVDGLPVVAKERAEKLKSVVKKQFGKYGNLVNCSLPLDDKESSKGYAYIEYESAGEAADAIAAMNQHKFDKSHTLLVDSLADYDEFVDEDPGEWVQPEMRPYEAPGNLRAWLENEECIDQYLMLSQNGAMLSIYANDPAEPELIEERQSWTDAAVSWSPRGTSLLTYHKRGVAIWAFTGASKSKQTARFSHQDVVAAIFSPDERFLVTCRNRESYLPTLDNAAIVWDALTGTKKRQFAYSGPDTHRDFFKIYKWSHDGNYLAYVDKDLIYLYEADSFVAVDKKPLKVPNVREVTWSPAQNVLAYWLAEASNKPAQLVIYDVDKRQELRARPIQCVIDCAFTWQLGGDYLCIQVHRYRHKKETKPGEQGGMPMEDEPQFQYSGQYNNLEIFHMRRRGKDVPVESIEMKETIHCAAWEPNGSKLCVAHGNPDQSKAGSWISFYFCKAGKTYERKKYFPDKSVINYVAWSPAGQYVVAAHLAIGRGAGYAGRIIFIDTNEMMIMRELEHMMLTDVEIDPTGRFVLAYNSYAVHTMDNEYTVYTMVGRQYRKVKVTKLLQLHWRPRPPTLLTAEKIKEIKRNLKKYSAEFDIQDKLRDTRISKDLLEKRRSLMDEHWQHINEQLDDRGDDYRRRCIELRNGVDTDINVEDLDASEFVEENVEFVIELVEEKELLEQELPENTFTGGE